MNSKIIKIIKWFVLASVLSSFPLMSYAQDRTSCDVAVEALQPEAEINTTGVKTFVVCNRDNIAIGLYALAPNVFKSPLVKIVADYVSLDTTPYYKNDIDVAEVITNGLIGFVWPLILCICLIWMFVRVYKIMSAKGGEEQSKERKNAVYFSFSFLLLGLIFFADKTLLPILFSVCLLFVASMNYMSSELIIFFSGSFSNDEQLKANNELLTQFDKSQENMISFAQVELSTKYATFSVLGYEMTRNDFGGFFDSSSTQKEIVSNIENHQKLNIVPISKKGIVNEVKFIWNTDFNDYDDDKYGIENSPFSISVNENSTEYDDSVDDTNMLYKLKAQGQNDAASIMTADRMLSVLRLIKSDALKDIEAGDVSNLSKKANLTYVDFVKNDFGSRLNSVRTELKMQRMTGKELSIYLTAYTDGYVSGLIGFNNAGTVSAKWILAQEAALAQRQWNCTNEFKKNTETLYLIDKVNGAGDTPWTKAYEDFGRMNTQCIISKDGVISFAGVDKDIDVKEQKKFANESMAITYAINMYNSYVSEGVYRAYKEQQRTKNEYANSMLKNINKGIIALPMIQDSLLEIKTAASRISSLIFSNSNTSISGNVSNELYLDYIKLFGEVKDVKDIDGLESFKTINTFYKPIVVQGLMNGSNVNASSSELRITEGEGGIIEGFYSMLQNQFTTLTDFKRGIGLDTSKSFEAGMNECATTDACIGRKAASIADFMAISAQSLGLGLKLSMFLAAIDALDAIKDIGSLVEYIGFSKNGALAQVLGFAGKLVSFIIDIIQIISALLWNVAYILIIVGFYAGYWLPAMLLVSFLMIQFYTIILPFLALIIISAFSLKAAVLGEMRQSLEGFRIIASVMCSILFRLIGLIFAIILIVWLPIGALIHSLFDFGYQGGMTSLIISYVLCLFTAAILFKAATHNLVEFITDKGSRLFNTGSSLFSSDTSGSIEALAQAQVVDKLINNTIRETSNKITDKTKETGKDIVDKINKNNGSNEVIQQSTTTQGVN